MFRSQNTEAWLHSSGGEPNGFVDALIAAAAADVAGHFFDDLFAARRSVLTEQGRCLHDLTGLTETALRHAQFAPRLLHWMIAVRAQAFDGRDGFSFRLRDGRLARPDRDTVDVDRAGAADAGTAAELRSSEIELVSQEPEKRHIGIAAKLAAFAIHLDRWHDMISFDAAATAAIDVCVN
jgi:hypothetical protein